MSLVRAIFPYEAADPHQLTLREGDVVTVVQRNPGGWWVGRTATGEIGIFPSSYTTEVKEQPKFSVPKDVKTGHLQTGSGPTGGGGGVSPRASLSGASGGGMGGMAMSGSRSVSPGGYNKNASSSGILKKSSAGPSEKKWNAADLGFGDDDDYGLGGGGGGGGFGSQSLPPNLKRIADVRKECRQLGRDMEKMKCHQKHQTLQQDQRNKEDEQVGQRVGLITTEVNQRHQRVTRMERTLDILRHMMEGIPSSDFNHVSKEETWLVSSKSQRPIAAEFLKPDPNAPPPRSPASSPLGGGGGSEPPRVRQEIVEEVVEEIVEVYEDEDESATATSVSGAASPNLPLPPPPASPSRGSFNADDCKDEVALKLIKKFKKRIAGTEEQKAEYSKQEKKLRKKLSKHEALFEEAKARLETLGNGGGGGGGTGGSSTAAATSSSAGVGAPTSNSSPTSTVATNPQIQEYLEAIKAQQDKKQKYEKDSVSDEMDQDQEQFRAALKKLQKRLTKGSTAIDELKPQVDAERAAFNQEKANIQNGEQVLSQADQAKVQAQSSLDAAVAEEAKALEDIKSQGAFMEAKVAKEIERVADFRKQLETLQAAAAEAAAAASGSGSKPGSPA